MILFRFKPVIRVALPILLATMMAGCATLDPDRVPSAVPEIGEETGLVWKTFVATAPDSWSDDSQTAGEQQVIGTRTTLDGTEVIFSKGEAISIYDGTGHRKFTAGEAGHSVTFSGTVSSSATDFYALSPYSSSTVFTKTGSKVSATMTLLSSQEAMVGSFEDGVNISAAKSSSSETFSLRNLLSVVKLTLSSSNLGGHRIASIKLSGDFPLAGRVTVNFGDECSVTSSGSADNSVTLSHANGSALTDGDYYIVVLPGSGREITLEFTDTEGYTAVKTATLKSAFQAGAIKDLGSVRGLSWSSSSIFTPTGWLEMPSYSTRDMASSTTSSLTDLYEVTHYAKMNGVTVRNYTMLYDPEVFASYWVAYPLCSSHSGGVGNQEWAYDLDVPESKQTNLVKAAYGVSLSTPNYPNNLYSRGHQIPKADRDGVSDMTKQTYYITNCTPQIQHGFNGGIWGNLENAVRALTSSCDTVYVVTGAAFRKVGGNEEITTIVNVRDGKTLPVPNYYWKALLKVRREGDAIKSARAVGFWIPHADLKGQSYTKYVVSVNTLESFTGLDLFANLPGSDDDQSGIEATSESNSSWNSFQNW